MEKYIYRWENADKGGGFARDSQLGSHGRARQMMAGVYCWGISFANPTLPTQLKGNYS